ncbi:hypothetical protein RRG08_000655 [Elysia crispata]|uniref:xanthine dehydrogenase n=1 Tax=Elysia crispata TaxID=231223 RepID=A0AAE1CUF4_9GAST|nr:hypothetical protein RRG08_000655 [Elysia crispata]
MEDACKLGVRNGSSTELTVLCDALVFYVNGIRVEEPIPDPEMTLLTYLRTRLLLTGSKLGCAEGGCGACTVMVSSHYSLNACLAPVCSMHGLAVTTVEGIGNVNSIHPVQERIAKFHGSQCGFCTPGIVMSMYTLLRNNPSPTTKEVQENFDGNLCRCTGYRSIIDGFRTFTKEVTCRMGSQCCQNKTNRDVHEVKYQSNGGTEDQGFEETKGNLEILGPHLSTLRPFDSTQEPIFPPELKVKHQKYHNVSLRFTGPLVTWVRPTSLSELLELKKNHPKARFVVGNTEVGIETKFKNQLYSVLVSSSHIPELTTVEDTDHGLRVGGSVTLSQLDKELKQRIKTLPEFKTRIFTEFVEMLKWFASYQIRNVASVSGNIMTASPISDLNPLFVAAGATVEAMSKDRGRRTLIMDKEFFCGYRRTALNVDEVLVSVIIPVTNANEFFQGFKQCNRKEDDISMVNAGMLVRLSDSFVVNDIVLAYGGMGPTVVLALKSMEAAIGHKWDESLMSKMCDLLPSDLTLTPGSPGGAVEYRRALALSFFFKFFLRIKQACDLETSKSDLSALQPMESSELKSIQVIGAQDSRSKIKDCVGQVVPHKAGLQQSTGQAVYVDDMTPIQGELHMALVTSTRSYAKILSIDPSAALQLPGVVDFVSAKDVPGVNSLGIKMDTVFAVDEVTCQGQIIGAIVAETIDVARRAARLVTIKYEDITPLIITIEEAIQHSSFYPDVRTIAVGDLDRGLSDSWHTLSGECRMNGQNHFYLETVATRALPGEAGEMEVFCSTQHAAGVQEDIAAALGISSHKIVVRTKRMGGGFGGKETQSSLSAVPTAVAAHKLHRPVRCVLDRDEDMVTTGNRHPFLGKYKVGFTSDGKLQALDLELYCNAGNSMDLTIGVVERAVLQIDACYKVPHLRIVAKSCKTNIMSNTAFRSFGGVQGAFIADAILEDIADFLKIEPHKIREANFFQTEDFTHFGMNAGGESVRRCWQMCLDKSEYISRRAQVDQYNRENRWKKKGLSIIPVRYGIAFLKSLMNQGGALVNIYRDGSVLISHGGSEMGQGLHTKVIQMASDTLQVPMSLVHISETATNVVPNGLPTAGSVSTDLYGFAVKSACETLNKRLEPVMKKKPKATWAETVQAAFEQGISLSATGFHKTLGLEYDMTAGKGKPFPYFTFGAACTEIQIDCLTGDHKLLRTDLVMDVGNSLNPAIDVGQIEGAFTQGYGLLLLEDVKVTPDGTHLTRGPGNYKIPAFGNIASQMNVYLVPDSPNPKGPFFSRGVGEPPLLLALSAFFAAKDAIKAAREEAGVSREFRLDSPALPQHIRMACADEISKRFPEIDARSYRPWTVNL